MKLKLSKYLQIIPIPAYRDVPEADRLLFSTRTGKIIRISSQFLQILQDGKFTELPDKLVAILLNNEILVPDDEAETDFIITRNLIQAADERDQSVTILLQIPKAIDPLFYTSLKNSIDAALSAIPSSNIKGFKYTVRLLLVLQHSIDWQWLPELDARLKEWQQPAKTQFVLQLLAINEGCNNLPLSQLPSTVLSKLYFVFNGLDQTTGITNATAAIQDMQQQLSAVAARPLQIHGVLLAAGACWENWSDDLVTALRSLSIQRKVSLEFVADEQEEALLDFITERRIRCSWLPGPQHRYYSSVTDSISDTVSGVSVNMLHADISWDAEDIRCMLSCRSLEAGKVYYDNNYVQYLDAAGSPCKNCLYLPICGGRANKLAAGMEDCPVFVRQLSERVAVGAGVTLH